MITLKEPKEILDSLERIFSETKPVSMFLYGSRARNDYLTESDYEIGVLYRDVNRPKRKDLVGMYDPHKMKVYPFVYEDFLAGNPDTPFPKKHYLFELSKSGKTIAGEDVVGGLDVSLADTDLLELVYFELGYAVSSMLSFRNQDLITSSTTFHKSVLFGARAYLYAVYGEFPSSYSEIANSFIIHSLEIDELYVELVRNAILVRAGEEMDEINLYTNFAFLNKLVLPVIKGMQKSV